MVTDIKSNYTSPAGKEFTLAAGRMAGVNPSSTVLDMGCGYGDGACNIAREFRSRITAVDISPDNIKFARSQAEHDNVSHLINFCCDDLLKKDFGDDKYDLALAEGGVLSFTGRKKGISLAHDLLLSRGWFAFSDLVILSKDVPAEILTIFDHKKFRYETEGSYRKLLRESGFNAHLMTLVPQSGWDNYYGHMARRLEDRKGFFSDSQIKLAFHREIDAFYRLESYKHLGYLFCMARKKN